MTSAGDYDATVTELCERALVTVIGNAGFWGRRLYLVGGLVPRYLVAPGSSAAPAHVGSRDVDLAVVLASSAVANDPFVVGSIAILRERFADARNDAPAAYATFMGLTNDPEAAARLRNEAVETVRLTLEAFDGARQSSP